MAYANTATYTFKIYDVGNVASWTPVACTVANWEVKYEANDRILPGIVPSSFSADFFGGMALSTWRSILSDSNNNYAVEIHKGLDVYWRGFIIPDQCSIEVANGQRFIRIIASDGFQMFDRASNVYKFTGVKRFTEQIAESLAKLNFWNLYDGFLASEAFLPNSQYYTTEGTLLRTGSLSEGLWWEDYKYNTYRDFFESLCTSFGFQLFQDKGQLVFRNVYDKTPPYYYYYNNAGTFVARFQPAGTTLTPSVGTDGNELYKPALREFYIIHDAQNAQGIFYDDPTVKIRPEQLIGLAQPSGSNHFDLDTNLSLTLLLPPGYPSQKVDVEVRVTARFNGYYWNGTAWTTSPTDFLLYTFTKTVANPTGSPALDLQSHSISNYQFGIFPPVPEDTFYFALDGVQVLGADVTTLTMKSSLTLTYSGGAPAQTIYYADNTKRRNGVTETQTTNLGDLFQISTATPKQLRSMSATTGTGNSATGAWNNTTYPLLELVAYYTARKNAQAHQYYEVDLTQTVWYNHLFDWGGEDYRPVNVSTGERNTRVTYKKDIDLDILTDPNTGRPDMEL